ncbi:TatD family hydrolase [Aceticella autotrophica]|uniref:TatD family hydrolase n=1 Tax=Aceticella autotrophica TaxID=2755338 RepID=A0A975GAT8_9THEO|nr:TatD family hydrolase [Aceticella autotrophica]QSZ27432.1 TatD family hydrolase [Aceticella autotrophica]
MLVDSHAHLEDEKFNDDREEIIKRCQKELTFLINVGSNIDTSKKSIELSKKYDFIYASVGIHPQYSQQEINKINMIEELAKNKKVVAIGEIGLDYHYEEPAKEFQKQVFTEHIRLAKKLKLPVIIHDREAHKDVLEIIKKEWDKELKGVFHSYSGSVEMAFQCIEMNFYISLAGPVTFKNARKTVEVAEKIPIDKLLIETDSPYLTPEPLRGKRNDPTNVKYVAKKIAEIRNKNFEEISEKTAENAQKLFNIKI